MFGYRLFSAGEIALHEKLTEARIAGLESQLKAALEYVAKCERLIEHERERVEKEQSRADRIADSVFQSNGLPAVSDEVRREQKAAEETAHEKQQDYRKELLEIYGESMDDLVEDGAEPLPQELAGVAKSL